MKITKNLSSSTKRNGNRLLSYATILPILAISAILMMSPILSQPTQAQVRDPRDFICTPPIQCPSTPLPRPPPLPDTVPNVQRCLIDLTKLAGCLKNPGLCDMSKIACEKLADQIKDIIPDGIPPKLPNPNPCTDALGSIAACLCEISGGTADACFDKDLDGVFDEEDNCPETANPDQGDTDNNGVGDACEIDTDFDGVFDDKDNCPETANPDQRDTNNNGVGDACEEIEN